MPEVILRNGPFLLHGLALTAGLAVLAAAGGTALGVAVAALRHARVKVIAPMLAGYVEVVRGTPLLVVLFICYFALPALLGYKATAFGAAALGFILFTGAYVAEDIRGGLAAVPKGQIEAGLATGLRPRQVLRLIVLPQALRAVIPMLFNQYVRLFKFTSVASVIGVHELTGDAMLVNARDFAPVSILAAVAIAYLVCCSAISLTGRALHRRLALPA
jgi:His/Glu/Gln/Arg/opine family amino acid ABC transporter permease subunit